MNETSQIRVLIADDHPLVRKGLSTLFATEPGIKLVGEAKDGVEVVAMARSLQPDVILLDLVMPRKSGIEAINEIMGENPDARILILTSFSEDDQVFPAITAGALGYLLKDTTHRELLKAIREVHSGQSSLHPSIARKLVRQISQPPDLPRTAEPLTPREVDVLQLVAQGHSNREIADTLTISERTVAAHLRGILGKLHLANRTQAALYALKEGIVSLDDI
jgi:NarL family two-component system response regulator LiaR